jgi:hypothetical protein
MRPMSHRLAAAIVAVLAALALVPVGALADGDPASDVLLGENVFYPYSPPVSGALQQSLNQATAAAKKAGFPIKVALIASPVDLGVIPDLFGKPQKYADFLVQEISFETKQQLLVVMPAGFGSAGLAGAATAEVAKLTPPAGKTSDDLARAALPAVSKLAAAAGHPISGGSSGGGGAGSTVLLIALAVAALAVAAVLLALRRRPAAKGPDRAAS